MAGTTAICAFAWYPAAKLPGPGPEFAVRAFGNTSTGWAWTGMEAEEERRRRWEQLEAMFRFYGALGYSHFIFCQDLSFLNHLQRRPEGLAYLHPQGDGYPDSLFQSVWKSAAARGLGLIPNFGTLSHQSANIRWVDSSISEFESFGAYAAFAESAGLPSDPDLNHVAAPLQNPAQDALFRIKLEFLRRNWALAAGDTAARPRYLAVGHDELGYDTVCFIKKGRSADGPLSAAELVARELELRLAQVDSVLGDSVRLLVYGDSFLPTDLGERYGLYRRDGKGVLALLSRWGYADRIVIIPWNHWTRDGDIHPWSRFRYSREAQLAYLDSLGFRYWLGVGEHGSNGAPGEAGFTEAFALGDSARTRECMLEWIRAAGKHPRSSRGIAHFTFEPFDKCRKDSLCTGFSAAWPAAWAWGRNGTGSRSSKIGIRAAQSRRDLDWVRGEHYP